jgi:hypothetical protein
MNDAKTICEALGGRWHGSYGLAFCPCHENTRTPALSLKDGDGGKLLIFCHAGCDARDILAALRAKGLLEGSSDWKPDPQKAEQRKAEEDAERRRRIDLARRCWSEAGPISSTLAESYLRARGITCKLSTALRWRRCATVWRAWAAGGGRGHRDRPQPAVGPP